MVAHHNVPLRGNPQRRRLKGWGDGESTPTIAHSSRNACGGWPPMMAQAHGLEERGV